MWFLRCAICVSLLLSISVFAKDRNRLEFSNEAFDLNKDNLSSKFAGNNCIKLAKIFGSIGLEKDKFESSRNYNERMSSLVGSPLNGSIQIGDRLGFVVSPYVVHVSYDADRQKAAFSLSKSVVSATTRELKSVPAITLVNSSATKRRFEAVNGFGARTVVTETTYVGCGLGFVNLRDKRIESYAHVEVEMQPERARSLTSDVGAVVVGKSAPPYLGKLSGFLEATLDLPTQTINSGEAILLELEDIWYYDRRSGEIVVKANSVNRNIYPLPRRFVEKEITFESNKK